MAPLIPPAFEHVDTVWLHVRCGHLNPGPYETGDPCGGCSRDTHPADVRWSRLETYTDTMLATPALCDGARLRLAATHARLAYPGPVGELLARELIAWQEFAYRFGGDRFIESLITAIEKRPVGENNGSGNRATA